MPVTINGTTGIVGPDGSASTPAIQGSDNNTGMFFPAADTVAIATGGTERVRTDSSGNVGIGTSSPAYNLDIARNSNKTSIQVDSGNNGIIFTDSGGTRYTIGSSIGVSAPGNYLAFNYYSGSAWSERARFTSDGSFCVNTTLTGSRQNLAFDNAGQGGIRIIHNSTTYNGPAMQFIRANNSTVMGFIYSDGANTQYSTSSDYRLKENIQPMAGGLDKVMRLKPCTYKWKDMDKTGEGFIAHELQEVVPNAVHGEKDAVNEDGSIKAQGIDTSFLVATLTAAIQELKAELDSVQAELATLKNG